MKGIGFVLALIVFIAIISGVGYALYEGWGFLSHQWTMLDTTRKPVVALLSSAIVISALLVILFTHSSFKKSLNSSSGKTMAYNNFMNWYVNAHENKYTNINIETIKTIRNEILLWAGNHVVKQFNKLYDELKNQNQNSENIEKYARHIYIEIQRDLGRRGSMKLRQI
ncbi:hypothetical protein [Aliikangiella coralliicola]|uniref:Uncharacterized protein n=1 Tax=Aliikangiella coralliicola TaxID=2592383 RepID=A0A545UD75_9GAMM|nr:hypothetical protein [Aliikangiella coralliicola]TQV87424.1 hypothetical protein FLL46_13350 [Aliikangiella coralliicola]